MRAIPQHGALEKSGEVTAAEGGTNAKAFSVAWTGLYIQTGVCF